MDFETLHLQLHSICNMDFVSRLKQYLSSRSISVTQFADECVIPRPTASQLLAGRNKKVSDEIIGKIHATYPDVSVVWLMFGEGDMLTDANIKISEAKNRPEGNYSHSQNAENKENTLFGTPIYNSHQKQSEKLGDAAESEDYAPYGLSQHLFSFSSEAASTPAAGSISRQGEGATSTPPSISITPGQGKSVTGIVVYYSDSTYESFIPDPEGRNPFMR